MTSELRAPTPVEVLLVEDDPGDVVLTEEALTGCQIANNLTVVMNGEDAISFLHKRDGFADAPTPDLILLDLNLPRRDGREVLGHIKSDPHLRRIPVVILTTSDAEDDVQAAYDLHANAYVRKPANFERFVSSVRAIDSFFTKVVTLPATGAAGGAS